MERLIKFNFHGEFVKELESLKKKYSLKEVSTTHCTTAPARMKEGYSTDTYLAEALANYVGQIATMHLFVGETTDNRLVCEYQKPGKDEIQLCIANMEKSGRINFKAGIVSPEGLLYAYDKGHRGLVFTMALMPYILQDKEAQELFDKISLLDVDTEDFSKAMCGLSNNIYYRLKDEKASAAILYEDTFGKMTQKDISDVKLLNVLTGEPKHFSNEIHAPAPRLKSAPLKATELRDKYILNSERILSREEQERVPDKGEWYVVPAWTEETAKKICMSSKFRKPIRNILLHGGAGTGKTEGSQAIASMLGLPYYTLSCSADDDKFDLIGQLVPNTGEKRDVEEICRLKDIPTFFDVECDFEGSFLKLFKRKPSKMDSPSDCYEEITKQILTCGTGGNDGFRYVESELIQAIKNGGFCEIQEANVIKRSSVMEALNPLLANAGKESFIKLPTGEIVHRHPDCVISMTINRDYDGCNNIQQAVYSRINLVKKIPVPKPDELFERTMAQTDFPDKPLLKKMSKCIYEIYEYSTENDISGGVSGPRELIDWAINTMLEETVNEDACIKAAFETVLEKAAQNDEDYEDIISSVFCNNFSVSKVDKIRKEL